eukprot:scaffold445517_cov29-Prasinocladus_malaysianus.AAC.2
MQADTPPASPAAKCLRWPGLGGCAGHANHSSQGLQAASQASAFMHFHRQSPSPPADGVAMAHGAPKKRCPDELAA